MLYDTPNKPKFDTNWQYNGVRLHSNVAGKKLWDADVLEPVKRSAKTVYVCIHERVVNVSTDKTYIKHM